MRHPTRAEIDKFNKLLYIKEDPLSQDWELEYSDPERLDEFIQCYHEHAKSEEEKFTLMALILGAFESYHILNHPSPEYWQKVKSLLESDLKTHRDHIEYYQCNDEVDGENVFPITKQIREIVI